MLNVEPIIFDFDKGKFLILNQLALPLKEEYIELNTIEDVYNAIKEMKVRGAPLIGIVALLGLYLGNDLYNDMEYLKKSRPTAVNIFNYYEQLKQKIKDENNYKEVVRDFIIETINKEEFKNLQLSSNGFNLVRSLVNKEKINFLTHCNTGSIATIGLGTALGVIKFTHRQMPGKVFVWVDETRPYLQGSRLTAWELEKENIDFKIITDSAAAFVMKHGLVDVICVGADRIAKNGDTANKIGTLNLAILSKYYKIPFIVVAPSSSIDYNLENLQNLKVEERDKREILGFKDVLVTKLDYPVYNPSFDITPANLIDYIVLEKGVYSYPYKF